MFDHRIALWVAGVYTFLALSSRGPIAPFAFPICALETMAPATQATWWEEQGTLLDNEHEFLWANSQRGAIELTIGTENEGK